MRYHAFILAALLVLSMLPNAGFAQLSPDVPGVQANPRKETSTRSVAAEGDSGSLAQELDRLNRAIEHLEGQQRDIFDEINSLEERLPKGSGFEEVGRADSLRADATAKARLVALYKFGQMGYASLLLAIGEQKSFAEARYGLGKLLKTDQEVFFHLRRRAERNQDCERRVANNDKSLEDLRVRLAMLDRELLSLRKEKLATAALGNKAASPGSDAQSGESQRELDNPSSNHNLGSDSIERHFTARKGSFPLPTAGEVRETYISRSRGNSHAILYNGGIIITAPKGQPVQAICDGTVVFSDWLKEYGRVMIIDHGGHYHTLIAHADELLKRVGESVKTDEVVATVGNTGSINGSGLYFEIRHHGKPLDPMDWLAVHKISKE